MDAVAGMPPGRLTRREQVRPWAITVLTLAATWAGTGFLPEPVDAFFAWTVAITAAVLLWTRGPRVGIDRRTALVLPVPLLGAVLAITALFRAFSPRRYWRAYPGWGRRGWTVAIGISAVMLVLAIRGAARDVGFGAASYEETALRGFEGGETYADERIARSVVQSTIDVGRNRRLAIVRVETTGGLVVPQVVDLVRREGVIRDTWERRDRFGATREIDYQVTCETDKYCLRVFHPTAVNARIVPTVPALAPELEGVPTDVPLQNGVVFIRNVAQVRALMSGRAELAAYDADGQEVPQLQQRLGAYEMFDNRSPAPGMIVVED